MFWGHSVVAVTSSVSAPLVVNMTLTIMKLHCSETNIYIPELHFGSSRQFLCM